MNNLSNVLEMDFDGLGIDPVTLAILIESNATHMDLISTGIKRYHQHEILKGRPTYGEYHHLFPMLRRYPEKFYEYIRMEISTFDYILAGVRPHCQKNWCNLHKSPIEVEERLVVTLR